MSILETVSNWEPWIRRVLIGLLSVLFGILLSRLIWVIIEPGGSVSQLSSLPRYNQSSAPSTFANIDTNLLTSVNPFDLTDADGPVVSDAPETTLNLDLIGTRSSNIDSFASATIVTPNNRDARVFRPGDEIISGVSLERVLSDKQILINRNGILESLRVRGRDGGFSVLQSPDQPTQNQAEETVSSNARVSGVVPDPAQLLQALDARPVFEGDNLSGYRLNFKGNDISSGDLGLQSGDVVIALDGDGPSDFTLNDLRDRLQPGSRFELTVVRQGQPVIVDMEIGG